MPPTATLHPAGIGSRTRRGASGHPGRGVSKAGRAIYGGGMSNAAAAPLMLSVSGCRGIFGKTMTPEVAARFGMVVGAWFVERGANTPPPSSLRSDTSPARAGEGANRPLVVLGRDGSESRDSVVVVEANEEEESKV